MDSQTSADASAGGRAAGAMTTAFSDAVKSAKSLYVLLLYNGSYDWCRSVFDLLVKMREILKRRGFDQIPQLSTEHDIDLGTAFDPVA